MRTETLTAILLLAAAAASPAGAPALRAETPPLLKPAELHGSGGPEAVAVGDVDGDGRDDVVATGAGRLLVFSQGADGRLRAPASYAASRGGSVAVGDINGDRRKDVVVDGVGVFVQTLRGTLRTMESHPAQAGSLRVRVGDFDADGRDDVVSIPGTNASDGLDLFLQDARGGLGLDRLSHLGRSGFGDLEAADVTGDGRADLVVVGEEGGAAGSVGILSQTSAGGGFAEPVFLDAGDDQAADGVGLGDVDGDGLADLVLACRSAHIAVLRGKAGGGFQPAVEYASAEAPGAVQVTDLDLDGRKDVVVLHRGGSVGVYLQGQDGRLAAERTFALPGGGSQNPGGLAVGDVNSDGLPDVVAASGEGLAVLPGAGQVAARPCAHDGDALCLLEGRFEVRVAWKDQHNGGREGVGHAVSRSDVSGTFWFFSSGNPELTVKAIDGRALNDRFWFFYGALSDVEYRVSVLDTRTGVLRAYVNPPGQICGRADTSAFSGETATSGLAITGAADTAAGSVPPPVGLPPPPGPSVTPGTCTADSTTLCLLGSRIKVQAHWKTRDGEGDAAAVADGDGAGFFWFFSPGNYELTVKAIDGHAVNDRFWFFYGALSDVEYWITITDVDTGKFHVYHNAQGNVCGQGDAAAL